MPESWAITATTADLVCCKSGGPREPNAGRGRSGGARSQLRTAMGVFGRLGRGAWMVDGPLLIVWLVAVGLVATACAGGGPAEDLLRDSGTRSDQDFLLLAEDELTKRCMERAGFRFITVPPDQLPVEPKNYQWGRDDVEVARKRGYGLSEKDPFQGFLDPNAEYKKSLSRSERERYGVTLSGHWENRIEFTLPDGTTFSISGDGCVAEARKKIYGDLRRYMR